MLHMALARAPPPPRVFPSYKHVLALNVHGRASYSQKFHDTGMFGGVDRFRLIPFASVEQVIALLPREVRYGGLDHDHLLPTRTR